MSAPYSPIPLRPALDRALTFTDFPGPTAPELPHDLPIEHPRGETPLPPYAFGRWYAQYPRKVGKAAARKASAKALQKATGEELLAGAMPYAAERDGQDPRYTRHPAT